MSNDGPFADYLDIVDVARELGINPTSVKRFNREGRIPMTMQFGKLVIHRDVFNEWASAYSPKQGPKKWPRMLS